MVRPTWRLTYKHLEQNPYYAPYWGKDEAGDRFQSRLADRNLSCEGIVASHSRPTTTKTRIISGHQHVVRVDEEMDAVLDDTEEQALLSRISDLLPGTDVVIFEDYDKGAITENIIRETISLAKTKSIPTVVDPKKRNFLTYKGATLFKPNLKELREGLKTDINPSNKEEIENAVSLLKEVLHVDGALITLSEYGVYVDHRDQKHHIGAHIREVSDVSGAGDTVISIAGLCTALGLSPQRMAALSNLGGGLVCEHVGVVPIDQEILKRETLKHDI